MTPRRACKLAVQRAVTCPTLTRTSSQTETAEVAWTRGRMEGVTVRPFVQASRLYDASSGKPVPFDWANLRPLSESQEAVERAVGRLDAEEA
ncbi:hypothetical protein VB779_03155 [Haloarculaceae archaeon H-GB11]|nr:hypothetical protein [Haloarculaceae archaeon H-GB11]